MIPRWPVGVVVLCLCVSGPAHVRAEVERRVGPGLVNFTTGIVSVVGVATPRILSPTGFVLRGDPEAMAQAHAKAQVVEVLTGLFAEVEVGPATLPAEVEAPLAFGSPLWLSDGTLHLPASLALRPPVAAGGETWIIELDKPIEPRLRIRLVLEGARPLERVEAGEWAGWTGDRVGSAGLIFVSSKPDLAPYLQRPHVRLIGRVGEGSTGVSVSGLTDRSVEPRVTQIVVVSP